MNDIKDKEFLIRKASERAAAIQEHRLKVLFMRTIVVNGQLREVPYVDGSRELGRGSGFWLRTGEAA